MNTNVLEAVLQVLKVGNRDLNNLTSEQYEEVKPFLNALLKKEVYAKSENQEDIITNYFILDYNTSCILANTDGIDWKEDTVDLPVYKFLWTDYGTKWAFTKEELEN